MTLTCYKYDEQTHDITKIKGEVEDIGEAYKLDERLSTVLYRCQLRKSEMPYFEKTAWELMYVCEGENEEGAKMRFRAPYISAVQRAETYIDTWNNHVERLKEL